jgi:hypothetical protein
VLQRFANENDHDDPGLHRDRKDRNVAERYEKRLQSKYDLVNIQTVFDKSRNTIGFVLNGKGKKVEASTLQPSNVIPFPTKLHQ